MPCDAQPKKIKMETPPRPAPIPDSGEDYYSVGKIVVQEYQEKIFLVACLTQRVPMDEAE